MWVRLPFLCDGLQMVLVSKHKGNKHLSLYLCLSVSRFCEERLLKVQVRLLFL
jgi:hypothetical protein